MSQRWTITRILFWGGFFSHKHEHFYQIYRHIFLISWLLQKWISWPSACKHADHLPSLHLSAVISQTRPLKRGRVEPEPHHHAKCSQIVFVFFFFLWGEAGGQDGPPRRGCWSLHDTPPLWCCTWPSINKQMKGSPRRSAELSWPICGGDLWARRDPKWPHAVSACQTAANLVFGDGQEDQERERWGHKNRGRGHKKGAWLALLPFPSAD